MGHDASLTFCFNKKNREALLTVYKVEFFLSKILRELHLKKKKKDINRTNGEICTLTSSLTNTASCLQKFSYIKHIFAI